MYSRTVNCNLFLGLGHETSCLTRIGLLQLQHPRRVELWTRHSKDVFLHPGCVGKMDCGEERKID